MPHTKYALNCEVNDSMFVNVVDIMSVTWYRPIAWCIVHQTIEKTGRSSYFALYTALLCANCKSYHEQTLTCATLFITSSAVQMVCVLF